MAYTLNIPAAANTLDADLQAMKDNFNLLNPAAVAITGGTITGVTDTITTEGVFRKQGIDPSPMYHFTGTTLTSGELYTLLGELCMNGWSHNTKINASGNFVDSTGTLKRDEAATCQLWVFTESGMIKCYNAPSASTSTSPVWTLTYSQNIATGDVTLASALPVASGGTSLATAATGGLLHAPSTNALGMLAIGAANLKLFVNAGGTLPEYAVGIAAGTFTRDTSLATGTQAITGLGFKPSVIFLNATVDTSLQTSYGTAHIAGSNVISFNVSIWRSTGGYVIFLWQTGSIYYYSSLQSFDADGFTLSWIKTGAKTGTATISYIAFR